MSHLDDGRVAFVAFGVPGELVEVTAERVQKDYVKAAVTNVLERASDRVDARCPLFGDCGGCQLQHMSYESQCASKEGVVREQLERIGGLAADTVRPIVAADSPWGYRNHVRFSTGKKFGDIGFIHRVGRRLLKVDSCPIADDWINALIPALQGKGRGLHQIQVRHSAATGEHLIAPEVPSAEFPTGQNSYTEALARHTFRVSANSFFQVNGAQAEKLNALVEETLPKRGSLLVDAFTGVGTFAIGFSGRFEHVIAIEESGPAIKDAKSNARRYPNVEIHQGKVEAILPGLEIAPDAVLLDPPRPGCAPPVLAKIGEVRPRAVVYVSCNPSTLARDARIIVDAGYRLESVTPIDMFPQTAHIECVARFIAEEV
ncbi:MAG TPA: class I SAM-dependent RNA methyltransferase [Dehalococcoidia bacterium]|nr:class I SAM-dependent RNA methyltransferase [Dehalococcoidia bacterium]